MPKTSNGPTCQFVAGRAADHGALPPHPESGGNDADSELGAKAASAPVGSRVLNSVSADPIQPPLITYIEASPIIHWNGSRSLRVRPKDPPHGLSP